MAKLNLILLLKTNRPQFAPAGSQLCSSIQAASALRFMLSLRSTIVELPNRNICLT